MDHHVRSAVTRGLRARGVDCLTALEDGTDRGDDRILLGRAANLDRVLFSQDVDLLAITQDCMQAGETFSGLIFGKQVSLTIGQAVRDLELIAKIYQPEEMRNRIQWIPLR